MTVAEAEPEQTERKKRSGPPPGTEPSGNTRYEWARGTYGQRRSYQERVERGGPEYRLRYRLSKTNTQAVAGLEDFSEWDDEELERGRRRDKNGTFRGRDPKLVPKEAARELARRRIEEAQQELADKTPELVRSLIAIATGDEYDEKARVQAIKEALDRTLGKNADQVNITVDVKPWERALQGAVVEVDSDEGWRPALTEGDVEDADIVDAEVVDDTDEYDDPVDDPEIDWDDDE